MIVCSNNTKLMVITISLQSILAIGATRLATKDSHIISETRGTYPNDLITISPRFSIQITKHSMHFYGLLVLPCWS